MSPAEQAKENRYNWFRGDSNNKEQRKKDATKVVWKFTKIFLLFLLFFTSLYGCVQSFIIHQDTHVGRGLEFYLNESRIPPHVSEFREDITKDTNQVYSIKLNGDFNVLLEAETGGPEAIKLTHDEIEKAQNAKMSSADGGINEALRLVNPKGALKDNEVLSMLNGTPITLSTATDINHSLGFESAVNANLYNSLSTWTMQLLDFNGTQVSYLPVTFKALPGGAPTGARVTFANAIFQRLNINNWFEDALGLTGPYAFPSGPLVGQTDRLKFDDIQNAQKNALEILGYLGYRLGQDANGAHELANIDGKYFMPGLTNTDYRPIVSWGDAWTKGVGPFYGLFVFPISKLQLATLDAFPFMSGWEVLISMLLVIFLLRFIGFLLSFKSMLQQTKMQELNLKKAAIDAKYAAYKGNKQMMARQRQEVAEMYKKENISPFGVFSNLFVTMPLFLAIWRVISALPNFKATVWLGINFSATSWRELFAGSFEYLPLMVLSVGSSVFSQLYPRLLTKKRDKMRTDAHLRQAMKKNNRTQMIVMIITAAISVIFSAGTQIYWIVGSIWAVIQAQVTHQVLIYRHRKMREK